MPKFKAVANHAPRVINYVQNGAAGAAIDAYIFTNPTGSGNYYEVVEAVEIHDALGTDAGAVTADVKIVPSGTTLASGTTVLDSTFNLKATADTLVNRTLHATNSRLVKPGDSLAVDLTGVMTAVAGLCIQVTLRPTRIANV